MFACSILMQFCRLMIIIHNACLQGPRKQKISVQIYNKNLTCEVWENMINTLNDIITLWTSVALFQTLFYTFIAGKKQLISYN